MKELVWPKAITTSHAKRETTMPARKRRRVSRGALVARLGELEEARAGRDLLTLYVEGPAGERWAGTRDGRRLTGDDAEALYRVAVARGDSFSHARGVDLALVVGDKVHSTEFSGRTDVHGGVVAVHSVDNTDELHDEEHEGGGS